MSLWIIVKIKERREPLLLIPKRAPPSASPTISTNSPRPERRELLHCLFLLVECGGFVLGEQEAKASLYQIICFSIDYLFKFILNCFDSYAMCLDERTYVDALMTVVVEYQFDRQVACSLCMYDHKLFSSAKLHIIYLYTQHLPRKSFKKFNVVGQDIHLRLRRFR